MSEQCNPTSHKWRWNGVGATPEYTCVLCGAWGQTCHECDGEGYIDELEEDCFYPGCNDGVIEEGD